MSHKPVQSCKDARPLNIYTDLSVVANHVENQHCHELLMLIYNHYSTDQAPEGGAICYLVIDMKSLLMFQKSQTTTWNV